MAAGPWLMNLLIVLAVLVIQCDVANGQNYTG